jgi:nucleoid-associated protein YgaU
MSAPVFRARTWEEEKNMSDNGAGTGTGSNGLWLAGGIIVILIGAGFYLSTRDGALLDEAEVSDVVSPAAPEVVSSNTLPQQDPATTPVPNADEETSASPVEEDAEETAAVVADAAEPVAPSIDEVRVDPEGTLVIAGRASPGENVDVLVDGDVVASAVADPSGAFAALGTLPASQSARSLTLRSGEGDSGVISVEEIILAPVTPLPAGPAEAVDGAEGAQVAEAPVPEAADTAQEDMTDIASLPVDTAPPADAETATSRVVAEADEGADPSVVAATDPAASAPSATAEQATQAPAAPEPAQTSEIAVLRSDEAGVSLVSPAAPPAAEVALDTIGYTDEGDVQLSGRAGLGAVEIRAYLNNSVVAQLPVDAEGNWRGEVPQIAAGVYTLRVDALNADGTVASRVETPFKREEPAVLAAATEGEDGPVRAVTVQAGDTLWAIARDRYGEGLLYVQVFEANRAAIRDPDLIYPGQVFDLPIE